MGQPEPRGAEDRAEDNAPSHAAGEDRVGLPVRGLGEPLDDPRVEVREIVCRHMAEIGRGTRFLESSL
jgi:hypothetical protein